MTDDPVGTRGGLTVAAAPETGEADAELAALIQARFDALMETWPSHATALGIHDHDGRLADLSRSAMEADIAAESAFLSRLGKVQLLQLREQERQRLGSEFSLRRSHDALLYSGDLPVSFHGRLLAGEGGGPTMPGRLRGA